MQQFLEVKNLQLAESLLRGIPNGIERAVTGTVNRTLGKVKTEIKGKVTSEYNIKKMEVEKLMVLQKANFSTLRGTISARSYRTPLSKFIGTHSRKDGIKVKVKKEEGFKMLQGKDRLFGKPFVANVDTGHKGTQHMGIFQRKQEKGRYPIEQLYTVSISEMIGSDTVSEYAVEKGQNYLENIMLKEVDRILKGYVK